MNYAIIRNEKYKLSNLQGISRHNERQNQKYNNKDIDAARTHLNYHLKTPVERSYEKEFFRLREENGLGGNLRLTGRKQSNVVCELIATSDSAFFESIGKDETRRYFETAYKFASKLCGEKNIISAVVHMDESSPHMHLAYIPVVKGTKKGKVIEKINCSEFWKGFNSYGIMQDDFHRFVTDRGFDLQRGERNADREESRKHLAVEEFKLKTLKLEISRQQERVNELKRINDELQAAIEDAERQLAKHRQPHW